MRALVRRDGASRGSAMIMAIFVLALLTGLGIALLTVVEIQMRMNHSTYNTKKVFYVAESGLEDGRETLRIENEASGTTSLDDELLAAAGPNGVIDFDPDTLVVDYDAYGRPVGFSGYDDDVPLRDVTEFGGGIYAAFLTNDAVDLSASPPRPLNDTNDRVLITAVAAGAGKSRKIVQGIVEPGLMPAFPATITMLGPNPDFLGGNGTAARLLTGDDCNGAGLPMSVPVVGVDGTAAELAAEVGVITPLKFVEGTQNGIETVDNVNNPANPIIDPRWLDCSWVGSLASDVRGRADYVGDSFTPMSELGAPGSPKTVYIDGDFTLGAGVSGAGLLWVTGQLEITGTYEWEGVIILGGKGEYVRRATSSNADVSGAFLVADFAGPDLVVGTADDCSGIDGALGTADDGFAEGVFRVEGDGNGTTAYCSSAIENSALTSSGFVTAEFRQR